MNKAKVIPLEQSRSLQRQRMIESVKATLEHQLFAKYGTPVMDMTPLARSIVLDLIKNNVVRKEIC